MGLGCVPYLPKVYISGNFQSVISPFYLLISFHGNTIETFCVFLNFEYACLLRYFRAQLNCIAWLLEVRYLRFLNIVLS